MLELTDKPVLVAGPLDDWSRGVCDLLGRNAARITLLVTVETGDQQTEARPFRSFGVEVLPPGSPLPETDYALAVVNPDVPMNSPLVRSLSTRRIPVIGDLELGFHQFKCLSIAIAGTNGKGTTARLVEQMLLNNHRQTFSIGCGPWPMAEVADRSRELDFLVLQAGAFQLERTHRFGPAVAVLLNLPAEHPDRYPDHADYLRANAGLFRNQQPFDWAIVQTETLARLKELNLAPSSKIVTFSAHDQQSDIYLDRGLIISRLANWSGPLLDMDQCRLRGLHNAENLMAALAVGHALRLPLEAMVGTLKTQPPAPHCFEFVAEINGVQYINDAKAANPDALRNALLSCRPGPAGVPNVWLIAGGRDEGLDFHAISPQISRHVKGAFLLGPAGEKIRSAWGLFTPCTLSNSLLEAVTEAAKNTVAGDVVLLSPACSNFNQVQNYKQSGERFYEIVKSISRGGPSANPNRHGKMVLI